MPVTKWVAPQEGAVVVFLCDVGERLYEAPVFEDEPKFHDEGSMPGCPLCERVVHIDNLPSKVFADGVRYCVRKDTDRTIAQDGFGARADAERWATEHEYTLATGPRRTS